MFFSAPYLKADGNHLASFGHWAIGCHHCGYSEGLYEEVIHSMKPATQHISDFSGSYVRNQPYVKDLSICFCGVSIKNVN